MNSVQDCLDALDMGLDVMLSTGDRLYKNLHGYYVYQPAHGTERDALSSRDLDSLLKVMLLRDATIDVSIHADEASVLPEGVIVNAD